MAYKGVIVPNPLIDLSGKRFGKLVVHERGPNCGENTRWHCVCDCGKESLVRSTHLRRGETRSCGCYQVEVSTKHGLCKHPLYSVWYSMRRRCFDPKHKDFKSYGGRGITVCHEWSGGFELFYRWSISNGWDSCLELDRIDNNSGYMPSNCRWVTHAINMKNTRKQENRSLPPGIYVYGDRFIARSFVEGEWKYLGIFGTQQAAQNARDVCCKELVDG